MRTNAGLKPITPKAAPQKTDAEKLQHIGNSLELMSQALGRLGPHLTDLSNSLYEWQDSRKPSESIGVVQAAEILLEEYAGDVENFRGWAADLWAEACGEGKEVEAK